MYFFKRILFVCLFVACARPLSLSLAPSLFSLSLFMLLAHISLIGFVCVPVYACVRMCVCLVAFAFKIFLSSASCAVCFDCFVLRQRPKGVGDVAEMARVQEGVVAAGGLALLPWLLLLFTRAANARRISKLHKHMCGRSAPSPSPLSLPLFLSRWH